DDRGDTDPFRRRAPAVGAAAADRAAVPGAAPWRLDRGDRRRRVRATAGRGEPRTPGRAAPRRATRVRPPRAGGAPPAARGRSRQRRPRGRALHLSGPVPAHRDDEPLPMWRPRRSRGLVLLLATAAGRVPGQAFA